MNRRWMNNLREEIGRQFSLTGKTMISQMALTGHLVADGGGPTTKGSRGGETARPQEKGQTTLKMGRKKDVRKVEENEKWRAANREQCKG